MKHLLETSALLAHHRQEPGWEKVQAVFDAVDGEPIVASLSLTESARRLFELGATGEEALKTVADYRSLVAEVVAIDAAIALEAFTLACRTTCPTSAGRRPDRSRSQMARGPIGSPRRPYALHPS